MYDQRAPGLFASRLGSPRELHVERDEQTEAEKAVHCSSFVGILIEFAISLQFGSYGLFANAIAWLANTSGQIFLISNDPVLGPVA